MVGAEDTRKAAGNGLMRASVPSKASEFPLKDRRSHYRILSKSMTSWLTFSRTGLTPMLR